MFKGTVSKILSDLPYTYIAIPDSQRYPLNLNLTGRFLKLRKSKHRITKVDDVKRCDTKRR